MRALFGSSQQRHVDADGIIKGGTPRAAGCGVVANQQNCVVIAVSEASFCSKNSNVPGVWPLVGCDVIAEGRREGLGAAKLEISANRVA